MTCQKTFLGEFEPYQMKNAKKKQQKIKMVMEEFKEGTLHSGSKKGPVVTKPKQALAIALSSAKISKKKKT